jgi:hypothetical protein
MTVLRSIKKRPNLLRVSRDLESRQSPKNNEQSDNQVDGNHGTSQEEGHRSIRFVLWTIEKGGVTKYYKRGQPVSDDLKNAVRNRMARQICMRWNPTVMAA